MKYSEGSYFTGQGKFLGHEACPRCQDQGKDRAGNNLGRWEDGHAYCFSCKYQESSTAVQLLEGAINAAKEVTESPKKLALPIDYSTSSFEIGALQWLGKYDIMREEILANDIGYSAGERALVFPLYDIHRNLMAYQLRKFSHDRKWMTYGNVKDLSHIIGWDKHPEGPVVVVEDIISAIKVGRHARAMPIFGSNASIERIMRLRFFCKSIIFWLDADKYPESMKASKRASLLGVDSRVVYTEFDPKDYDNEAIVNILRG